MLSIEEACKETALLMKELLDGGKHDMIDITSAEAGVCMILAKIYDKTCYEIQDIVHNEFIRITTIHH